MEAGPCRLPALLSRNIQNRLLISNEDKRLAAWRTPWTEESGAGTVHGVTERVARLVTKQSIMVTEVFKIFNSLLLVTHWHC